MPGIVYGFLTTIQNLVMPLASLFSANLAQSFHLYDASGALQNDHAAGVRMLWLDTTGTL